MIRQLSVGPIGENVYIIEKQDTPLIVVDPGAEGKKIFGECLLAMDRSGAASVIVACTHGHLDHTGAIPELLACLHARNIPALLCAPKGDAHYFGGSAWASNEKTFIGIQATGYLRKFFVPIPAPDFYFVHGDVLPGTDALVIHTPGHTPGSSCFLVEGGSALISGDTLFLDGRGRTDTFDADEGDLVNAVRERLLCLSDSVRVWPGHGDPTTIGHEKRYFI